MMKDASTKEEDILCRSTKRTKGSHSSSSYAGEGMEAKESSGGEPRKSNRDLIMGEGGHCRCRRRGG